MIEFDAVSHLVEVSPGSQLAALDDVSLRLERGEYLAVMGPNGSGKTTLARHMNALLVPTRGTVVVDGIATSEGTRLWSIRQAVGMVFQNPDHQMVAPVVEEEVAFGPENLGLPVDEIRARIDEALAAVDMLAWRKHNPANLSGGQKQRVAIASILAMRPRVMVLDEPTAMLDAAGRKDVLAILRRLNRELGMAIILITHSMDEAAEADRVLVMQRGRIAADGPLQRIAGDLDTVRRLGLTPPAVVRAVRPLIEAGLALPTPFPLDATEAARAILTALQNRPALTAQPPATVRASKSDGRPRITLRDVWYHYMRGTPFETIALRGLNAQFREGERIAVMGGTGSGKSTMVAHTNGLLRATRGEVIVGTQSLNAPRLDIRAVRREVGLVFQFAEQQLFEETVARDVAYGPRNLGLAEDDVDVRVRRAFRLVGLDYDQLADRSTQALSGGEKRRAALAGVLAMEPRVLVMDEPTAGLDAAGQDLLIRAVLEVQAAGTATITVTHDVEVVPELADRLLVLEGGQIKADGPLSDVLGRAVPPPAATRIARALRAEGLTLDDSVVGADALAQEVIHSVMNQTAG